MNDLSEFDVTILDAETFINGNMAVVITIQNWTTTMKDGTVNEPLLVRQTDCFGKQDGKWKIIHEHSSIPSNTGWNGKFVTED